VRRYEYAWLSGIYGALAFVILPIGFILPGPLWIGIVVVPAIYIAGAVLIGVYLQRWSEQG
jgi:hypothetical protein